MKKLVLSFFIILLCLSSCSSNNKAKGMYSYKHDVSHLYLAKHVSDDLIKIECWFTHYSEDPFFYDHDVTVIENNTIEWLDESHSGFSILMKDEKNSKWDDFKTVTFTICDESINNMLSTASN